MQKMIAKMMAKKTTKMTMTGMNVREHQRHSPAEDRDS